MIRPILFILCSIYSGQAASWYLDNAATGADNGTSWVNAWRGTNTLNWASINPGDTLFISGGTASKIYTEDLFMPNRKSGSAAGGYITIRIGQEPGHNGVAIFDGVHLMHSSTSEFIWIDGGRSPSFVPPTNHQQVISGPSSITNNIGFWIRNLIGVKLLQNTDPVCWYFSIAPRNMRYSYVEVSGLSNTLVSGSQDWRGSVLYVNASGGTTSSNVVFEYLYLHDNVCAQFINSSRSPGFFDAVVFKFGHITRAGEDNFQIGGGGWTIRDSVIGEHKGYGKIHADMFQLTGSHFKIYNNDLREINHSLLRFQTYPNGEVGLTGELWYYNNIVTEKPGRTLDGGLRIEQLGVVHYDPDHPTTNVTLTNMVFANNLFYRSIPNLVAGVPRLVLNPLITFSKGAVKNASIKSSKWVNNIAIDRQGGLNFPATTNVTPAGYVPYTTNELWVDYNILWATNPALNRPMNVNYLDRSGMFDDSNPYRFSNKTNSPVFEDEAGYNFELLSSDTAALNSGYDMSAYFNYDALNRPRLGAWDRGPLEKQQSGPVAPPTKLRFKVHITADVVVEPE